MALAMVRIDDRLIHGQVVAGWCPRIKPDRLVLCNDEVAKSDWESDLYRDAADDYKTSICSVAETVRLLQSDETRDERVFLIVESPRAIVQLLDRGLQFEKVVIGGLHYQPGKRDVAPFIYVDDEDIKDFQVLVNQNIAIEGRDVPTAKAIDLVGILGLTSKGQ